MSYILILLALDKDNTSDRIAKKTSEILSSKAQNTKENLSHSDSNDNHCTDPIQSITLKNDDNSCGIGRKLRQKRRNTTHSPNRKVPPFKVKAHKVSTYDRILNLIQIYHGFKSQILSNSNYQNI